MNDVFKIENSCSSADDFKKMIRTKPSWNVFFRVPVIEWSHKDWFYLEFADLNDFHLKSDSFTVALCHKGYNEKVIVYTVRLSGKFLYNSIMKIAMAVCKDFHVNYSWMKTEYIKEFFNVRESLQDIAMCVRKGTYKNTPTELKPFQYWLSDSGNVIMAVPECLLKKAEASGNLYLYEVGIPCSYVIEKGYRFHKGYVIVDAPYDPVYGVDIPDNYECW